MLRKLILLFCLLLCTGALAEAGLIDQWDTITRIPDADGMYLVCRNEKWGIINREGEIIIEPLFRYEPEFKNGYAVVAVADAFAQRDFSYPNDYGSLFGVISAKGRIILPAEYESVEISEAADTLLVQQGGKYGFADMEGNFIIRPKYDRAHSFEGDYAAVAMDYEDKQAYDSLGFTSSWGAIDRSGKLVVPLDYDWLDVSKNGLMAVRLNDKYGYINAENETVIDFKYWAAEEFISGYAAVAIKETLSGGTGDSVKDTIYCWGAVDENGKEVIPCEYEHIALCENGLALAHTFDGEYRFLATDGKSIAKEGFYRAEPFIGDYAAVGRKTETTILWGAIDSEGKEILPMEYDWVKINPDGTIETTLRNVYESYTVQDGSAVKIEDAQTAE